jgi:hypothetical protein
VKIKPRHVYLLYDVNINVRVMLKMSLKSYNTGFYVIEDITHVIDDITIDIQQY